MTEDNYPPDVEPLPNDHEFYVELADLVDKYSEKINRPREHLLYDLNSFYRTWMDTLSATGALWRSGNSTDHTDTIYAVIRDCKRTPVPDGYIEDVGEWVIELELQPNNNYCEVCDDPTGGVYSIKDSDAGIPYCRSCLEDEWYVKGTVDGLREFVDKWV